MCTVTGAVRGVFTCGTDRSSNLLRATLPNAGHETSTAEQGAGAQPSPVSQQSDAALLTPESRELFSPAWEDCWALMP